MKYLAACVATLLLGCAARSPYLTAPAPADNVSAGLSLVSLSLLASGACELTMAVKGAGMAKITIPAAICADAKRAKEIIAASAQAQAPTTSGPPTSGPQP